MRGQPVPIAIGLIGWVLDITESSDDPCLLAILDEVPPSVWFAVGIEAATSASFSNGFRAVRGFDGAVLLIDERS
jgi:nitronate monooxygenase